MDENDRHCEALVYAVDKDRYLATLFAPADKRGPLFVLYAFNAEIGGVRERAREPMTGAGVRRWWGGGGRSQSPGRGRPPWKGRGRGATGGGGGGPPPPPVVADPPGPTPGNLRP